MVLLGYFQQCYTPAVRTKNEKKFHTWATHPKFSRTCKTFALVGLAALASLTSVATAPPWKSKDWRQWTPDECKWILHRSPWAIPVHVHEAGVDPKGNSASNARVLITSALAIRRAMVTLGQEDALCLNGTFNDRIEVTIIPDNFADFKTAPELIISNRKYQALRSSIGDPPLDPCVAFLPYAYGGVNVYEYPRIVDGSPVIGPSDKKLVIMSSNHREFEFNIKNMIYDGKPDY